MLTITLSLGIICGYYLNEWNDLLPFLALTLVASILLLYFFGLLQNRSFLLITVFSTILLGYFHIQKLPLRNQDHSIEDVYIKDDALLIRINEVDKSKREWKKMTGTIKKMYHSDKEYSFDEPIVLYVKSDNFIGTSGDEIITVSDLSLIKNAGNPGEFDAANYWNKKGYRYMAFIGEDQYRIVRNIEENWITKKMNTISSYLNSSLENNLNGKELAIAKALILGDKSLLDIEIRNSFSNTGAMHVLAVSGLHVGIIMQILLFILSKFSSFISKNHAVLLVVIILWIYAFITGMSPSVVRSVLMFSILFFAQLMGKQNNSINALFFTGFVLLLYDPHYIFDIGFQLSFLAMLGIFLFYRSIEKTVFIENKILKKVWQGTALGFSAQLMTTPFSLYYFHQFPNYFVVTNVGLMVTSGLILGLGLVLFSVSWWKFLAGIVGYLLSVVLFISLYFIEWVEDLPGGVAQGFDLSISVVAIMSCLLLLFFLVQNKKLKIFLYAASLIMLALIVSQRFDKLNKSELCVFNARQLILTVKLKGQLFCFYKAKKEDFNKVKFVVESYRKLNPSKVVYIPIDVSNWKIISDKININTTKIDNNYLLLLNGESYYIRMNDYNLFNPNNATTIGMPWVESELNHSLKNAAFIKEI